MKKALTIGAGLLLTFPLVASAQTVVSNLGEVGSLIINTINDVVVPVLFAIAFIVFVWGAFQTFIVGYANDEVKEKGRNLMLWGLIGFFVMVSVWGLVNIIKNTVPLDESPLEYPVTGGIGT